MPGYVASRAPDDERCFVLWRPPGEHLKVVLPITVRRDGRIGQDGGLPLFNEFQLRDFGLFAVLLCDRHQIRLHELCVQPHFHNHEVVKRAREFVPIQSQFRPAHEPVPLIVSCAGVLVCGVWRVVFMCGFSASFLCFPVTAFGAYIGR